MELIEALMAQWFAHVRAMPWSEIKGIFELVLYYLAVLTALGCLFRLRRILETVREFNKGRGPLGELRDTVDKLAEMSPRLEVMNCEVTALAERIEALHKQMSDLQLESISTRVDEGEAVTEENGVAADANDSDDEHNWQLLRAHWRRNMDRLEYIIDNIDDGRTKAAFDRMSRRRPTAIVNRLEKQELISRAAANASRDLIKLFNRYRPRGMEVGDEAVGALQNLEVQLDRELVPYSKVAAAEEAGVPPPDGPAPLRPPGRNPPTGETAHQPAL